MYVIDALFGLETRKWWKWKERKWKVILFELGIKKVKIWKEMKKKLHDLIDWVDKR